MRDISEIFGIEQCDRVRTSRMTIITRETFFAALNADIRHGGNPCISMLLRQY